MALLYAKVMVSDEQFAVQTVDELDARRGRQSDAISSMACFIYWIIRIIRFVMKRLYKVMQILMIGLSLRPQVEVHTARGRSDMEVEVGDKH